MPTQGTLPAFSIVDPDFKSYSEENPHDIQQGESFASEVIKRVMHGKGWADTLLIWLYDEHGGYYDHVPPPAAVEPDDVLCRSVLSHGTWQHGCSGCCPRVREEGRGAGRRARGATTATASGSRRSWSRRTPAATT